MATLDTTKIDIEEAISIAERAIQAFKDTQELVNAKRSRVSGYNINEREKALKIRGKSVARMISPMIEHAGLPEGLRLRALIVLADLETYL